MIRRSSVTMRHPSPSDGCKPVIDPSCEHYRQRWPLTLCAPPTQRLRDRQRTAFETRRNRAPVPPHAPSAACLPPTVGNNYPHAACSVTLSADTGAQHSATQLPAQPLSGTSIQDNRRGARAGWHEFIAQAGQIGGLGSRTPSMVFPETLIALSPKFCVYPILQEVNV